MYMSDMELETLNLTENGQVEMKFSAKEKYNIAFLIGRLEELKERLDDDNDDVEMIHALAFAIHMIENRGDAPRVNPTPPPVMDYYRINMIKAVRDYAKTIGLSNDSCPPFGLKEAKDMVEYAIAKNEESRAYAHTRTVLGD